MALRSEFFPCMVLNPQLVRCSDSSGAACGSWGDAAHLNCWKRAFSGQQIWQPLRLSTALQNETQAGILWPQPTVWTWHDDGSNLLCTFFFFFFSFSPLQAESIVIKNLFLANIWRSKSGVSLIACSLAVVHFDFHCRLWPWPSATEWKCGGRAGGWRGVSLTTGEGERDTRGSACFWLLGAQPDGGNGGASSAFEKTAEVKSSG